MNWFTSKPSTTDRLLDALEAERSARLQADAANAAVTERLVSAMEAQSRVTQEWLSMLSTSSAPQVRVMTELDEVALDHARRSASPETKPLIDDFDPERWMHDMKHSFGEVKNTFFA
jgi:hypothetical protein